MRATSGAYASLVARKARERLVVAQVLELSWHVVHPNL
jgi:hypothetical protein